jgi:hypothetical protein
VLHQRVVDEVDVGAGGGVDWGHGCCCGLFELCRLKLYRKCIGAPPRGRTLLLIRSAAGAGCRVRARAGRRKAPTPLRCSPCARPAQLTVFAALTPFGQARPA